jgi:hypothetical protein
MMTNDFLYFPLNVTPKDGTAADTNDSPFEKGNDKRVFSYLVRRIFATAAPPHGDLLPDELPDYPLSILPAMISYTT